MGTKRQLKMLAVGLMLSVLGIILACGESATPLPTATATGTPTVTATPTATPTQTPLPTAVQPFGTLDVGFAELGPPVFSVALQPYIQTKYNHLITHENLFVTQKDPSLFDGQLATGWSVEEVSNGWKYIFNLQEGVPWHKTFGDFGDFTADDVIFTLEQMGTEGAVASPAGPIRATFLCDECSLTAIDDHTMELVRPTATFDILWSINTPGAGAEMHSKDHFEAVGSDRAISESVGTGPWRLVDFQGGSFKRAEAVIDHWRHTPEWAEITWHEILEESTRVANFLTGAIDTGSFSGDSIEAIKQDGDPDVKYMRIAGAVTQYTLIHGQQYYTDAAAHNPDADGVIKRELGNNAYDCSLAWVSCDRTIGSEQWENARKVRLAMSLAIDRQKLVNNVAFGEGVPTSVALWLHPTRAAQFGIDQLEYPYDPARARELLAEAGYADGFEIFMALVTRPAAGAIESNQAVATMWEEIGITVLQENTPKSVWRPQRVARTAKGAQAYNNPPGYPEPMRAYDLFYTSTSSFNQGFEHPVYEAMVRDAQTLVDDDERWAAAAEIARFLFDNVMLLPLYHQNTTWPLSAEVDEWELLGGTNDWLSNWEFVPHRR